MTFLSRIHRTAGVFLVLTILAGCATQPQEPGSGPQVYDPIEPVNRVFFAMNETVDTFVLQPTAFVYKTALPDPIQDMVRNFLRWLRSPVVIANSLLQGDTDNAGNATRQLFVNGLTVGLIDWGHGQDWGYRNEDFGQTLGYHGVDGGPYLVIPLLGPSNGRDLVGRVVDIFFDPLTYIVSGPGARNAIAIARNGTSAVDFRARNFDQINELKASSVDYYARLRSIYLQRREAVIHNGKVPDSALAADGSKEFEDFSPTDRPRSVTGALPAKSN
jgi:phospholipid-binding lipoprotein MlaA|tara:strand:- start:1797 stop:2618 length:822 start_codon:yes stop_codon:yes gene_type:complete